MTLAPWEPNWLGQCELPATGMFIRNAANIDISHVDIAAQNPDARPGFWLLDVDGFDGSFLTLPAGAPSFVLDRVSAFRTFGSRAVADKRFDTATTTTF